MKKDIRINYIFWKEAPLLFDAAHIVPMFVREGDKSAVGTFPSKSKYKK